MFFQSDYTLGVFPSKVFTMPRSSRAHHSFRPSYRFNGSRDLIPRHGRHPFGDDPFLGFPDLKAFLPTNVYCYQYPPLSFLSFLRTTRLSGVFRGSVRLPITRNPAITTFSAAPHLDMKCISVTSYGFTVAVFTRLRVIDTTSSHSTQTDNRSHRYRHEQVGHTA
jgi:hypothetical protein